MKKRYFIGFVVILLVLGSFNILAQEEDNPCDSVLEKVWCFLWGNPDNRAGAAWWDRGALVGMADRITISEGTNEVIVDCDKYPSQCAKFEDYEAEIQAQRNAFIESRSCGPGNSQCVVEAELEFETNLVNSQNDLINEIKQYQSDNPNGDSLIVEPIPEIAGPIVETPGTNKNNINEFEGNVKIYQKGDAFYVVESTPDELIDEGSVAKLYKLNANGALELVGEYIPIDTDYVNVGEYSSDGNYVAYEDYQNTESKITGRLPVRVSGDITVRDPELVPGEDIITDEVINEGGFMTLNEFTTYYVASEDKTKKQMLLDEYIVAYKSAFDGDETALNKDIAKALYDEAQKMYISNDFEGAKTKLKEAYELDPNPKLLFNIARAEENLGDYDGAKKKYQEVLNDESSSADLKKKANEASTGIENNSLSPLLVSRS